MALTISELNTVSKRYFDDTMTQQAYDDYAFFAILRDQKRVITDGGTSIQVPIRYKKFGKAQTIGFRQKITFESIETRTGLNLEWKGYEVDTVMHWDDRLKNSGSGKIIDLARDKSTELSEDMGDKMSTDLYATTQADDAFNTIDNIVSTSAYGGVAVSDAAQWTGRVDSTGTVVLLTGANSLSYMRNQATFGKNGPTHHFTTRDLVSKYESLLQPQQRYEDKRTANLGFANVTYYNKPVIGDPFCTAKYWYGIDMTAFELRVHPDYNMKPTDWFDLKQVGYAHALGKILTWAGNLLCRRRKTNFKFTLLDYTL